ncbi:MAG: hypothetical protein KIT09_20325 [Bryobacteraceae bacterium]|nr:hypothetical protein [Bryobacteraceae bacterium]
MGDAAPPGKPAKYDQTTEQRVLALLDERPPKGYSQWNGSRLAEHLGDASKRSGLADLAAHDICLQRRRSWCISTDPEFGPKAADAVGLHLNPPREALILSVDEKPFRGSEQLAAHRGAGTRAESSTRVAPGDRRGQRGKTGPFG